MDANRGRKAALQGAEIVYQGANRVGCFAITVLLY